MVGEEDGSEEMVVVGNGSFGNEGPGRLSKLSWPPMGPLQLTKSYKFPPARAKRPRPRTLYDDWHKTAIGKCYFSYGVVGTEEESVSGLHIVARVTTAAWTV